MTRGAFCAAHAKGFQTNCRLLGTGDLKNPIFALAVGGFCEARKSGANGAAMPTDDYDQGGYFFFDHPERGATSCLL